MNIHCLPQHIFTNVLVPPQVWHMAACQSLYAFAHASSLCSDGTENVIKIENLIHYGGVVNFLLVSEFNSVGVRIVAQ